MAARARTGYVPDQTARIQRLAKTTYQGAKDKKEKYLDLFSIHQYPNWDQTVPALLESPKTDMASLAATIKGQLSAYPALADIPVWMKSAGLSRAEGLIGVPAISSTASGMISGPSSRNRRPIRT